VPGFKVRVVLEHGYVAFANPFVANAVLNLLAALLLTVVVAGCYLLRCGAYSLREVLEHRSFLVI